MSDGDGGTWQEKKTEVEFYGLCSGGFWGKYLSEGDVNGWDVRRAVKTYTLQRSGKGCIENKIMPNGCATLCKILITLSLGLLTDPVSCNNMV